MSLQKQNYLNLPNLVSSLRLLLAPLLFYLALNGQQLYFLAVLLFSGFTDVLDGFLARRLKQITRLGARLDSWGDFTIYSTMAICAWMLWPDIVQREWLWFTLIVASFSMPVLVGLIKFKCLTSYHTWSVKLAVAITFVAYVLLFSGLAQWPFVLAALLCLYAGVEEILITLVLRAPRIDVRSIRAALKSERLG